jgi:hypothetical protein
MYHNPRIAIIAILLSISGFAVAQCDIKFSYKGKEFNIPNFIESKVPDSVNPTGKVKVLQPIDRSSADLEIRQYYPIFWLGSRTINCLSFFKDSCVKTVYHCLYYPYSPEASFIKNEGYIKYDNVWVKITQTKVEDEIAVKILDSLQKLDFFHIKDQTGTINLLKKEGVKINDPCYQWSDCWCGLVFYEVKINNYHRNLNREDQRYYKYNPHVDDFKDNLAIAMIFDRFNQQ